MNRIEKEKRVVDKMIDIYYRKQGTTEEREILRAYAMKRLDNCKFGENKSFCSKCPIHCYAPKYKEQIRKVMRYSGPRMMIYHPIMLVRHIVGEKRRGKKR